MPGPFAHPIDAVRTPHKFPEPILTPTYRAGDFDSRSTDAPFLFRHDGRYRMFYVAFDGTGYRTGLASSDDLLHFERDRIVHDRGPAGSLTQFNITITSVLRDPQLLGDGDAQLIDDQLLGVWHGYPDAGQEQGKGYVGLARGNGLTDWQLDEPFLLADDGAPWEAGGIYKPAIVEHAGRYFVFYNAKDLLDWPWREQIGVA